MKRVFAFIGFTCAITLFVFNIAGYKAGRYILPALAVLLTVSLLIKDLRQGRVIPVVLAASVFAGSVFMLTVSQSLTPQLKLDGEQCPVVFRIVDIPEHTESGYKYTVKTTAICRDAAPQNIRLKVSTKNKLEADYYDDITAVVKLKSISDNPFDSFGSYGDGIFLKASVFDYSVSKTAHKPLNFRILKAREYIFKVFDEALPEDCAALSSALITGSKDRLSDGLYSDFKVCGVSHIIAVSGLHTSIICLGLYTLLKRLGVHKLPNAVISLCSLAFYAGIADFSKSVMRSAVMISVLIIGELLNSKSDTLNSLGIATFILCFNPFAVTDMSAVLTVSALLGIIVLKPRLDLHLKPDTDNRALIYFYNLFALGVCGFTAVFIPVWVVYRSVSLISVFLNLIIVPLAELAIASSMLFVALAKVPIITVVLKVAVFAFTKVIIVTVHFFSAHFGVLYLDLFSEYFGIAAAAIVLFCGIYVLYNGKVRLKHILPFGVAVFILSFCLSYYNYLNTAYLYVNPNGSIVITYRDLTLAADIDNKYDYYDLRDITKNRTFNTKVYINSDYDLTDDGSFNYNNHDVSLNIYDCITVTSHGDNLTFDIFGSSVSADKDYVRCKEQTLYLGIRTRFGEDRTYILELSDGCETVIKEG